MTTLPSFLLQSSPWDSGAHPIWPASTFLLRRNVGKNNFPGKLSTAAGRQLLDLLKELLLSLKQLDHPLFLDAASLSPLDKEFLYEHFLCHEGFQNTLQGQGFIIDASSRFLTLLNIGDHLEMQIVDCTGTWEPSWNRLVSIEAELSNSLEYAYSSRFGYLTADPTRCGTALEITSYLHVPALIHTGALKGAISKRKEEDVVAGGMLGSLDELIGDVLVLRNRYTLGVSEEGLIQALERATTHFTLLEETVREEIKKKEPASIKDEISRSYGLLTHSYQLQTKEALGALSMLKLGIHLGWVKGMQDKKINELFFQCRRAHLSHLFPQTGSAPEAVARCRAAFLHEAFKPVQILTD